MLRSSFRRTRGFLCLVLLSGCSFVAVAASTPTLFTMTSAKPEVMAQGAQKSWPVRISEDKALEAVFQGGMWLPTPAGGRIYAKYQRHIVHANGIWTWVGTVATVHGEQSVVLTFGKNAVFGVIPQAQGNPLRIVTRAGQTRIVATSAKAMARSAEALRLVSHPDYRIPPRKRAGQTVQAGERRAAAAQVHAATAADPVTIDVMVAYTPDFTSALGGESQALTRIQSLVDITNQAYTDSAVHQQIRLVHTVAVDYPKANSNEVALDDLTGVDGSGNPVTVPASLQAIASLRTQYGADLVAMIRNFVHATSGDCGVGWLSGGGETQIIPSQDKAWGFSVVSDGSDDGYYCEETTLAHELGHNMGDAHDRANADGPGAYSYSYGYSGNGLHGFSTIMSYGTNDDTPIARFSNPDVATCQGTPCGVADSDTANSADNAHSMNNTAALIAQFEPTAVAPPVHSAAHNDVDGDGKSDILFMNPTTGQFVYWLMHGKTFAGWAGFTAGPPWQVIGTGDFDGDGHVDLLCQVANSLHIWLGDGHGGFVDKNFLATPAAGWHVIGTGDIDGNGSDDIFWYNQTTHQVVYWLVDHAAYTGYGWTAVTPGFVPGGIGRLASGGHADIVWTDASNNLYVWIGDGTGGFQQQQASVKLGSGWVVAGVADVNGDGRDDVISTQASTGGLEYFLMDGSQVTDHKTLHAGAAYKVAGVGDFDGDGMADILWTSGGDDLWMWLHSAPTQYYGAHVQAYAAGWDVLP